jgi:large subunit ribosomal protein L15
MLSHEITSVAGKSKERKRVGRGRGSGIGKTCGRGHKGTASRAGSYTRPTYEGGQMALFRRLPKRGFNNFDFENRYEIVNIWQLDKFDDGSVVGPEQLVHAGFIDNLKSKVKILGDGVLTKKLDISAHKFSKSAQEKINGCGGTAKVVA